MRRRLVVTFGILLVLGLLALALILSAAGGPGPTKANFERVTEGMPLADVEALLGPPNDTSPSGRNWSMLHNGVRGLKQTVRVWGGDDGAARIYFDPDDCVDALQWVDRPESTVNRLRRRLWWLPFFGRQQRWAWR